jgi:hypothetical protein
VVRKNEISGSLLLDGAKFADYHFTSNNQLEVFIIPDSLRLVLDQKSAVPLDGNILSLLTWRGNYIAFVSNRDGDEKGDIYIYTVDTNANLDTVFYYEAVITSRDTVIDSIRVFVYDTVLTRKFIEPIRRLTDFNGRDENPS